MASGTRPGLSHTSRHYGTNAHHNIRQRSLDHVGIGSIEEIEWSFQATALVNIGQFRQGLVAP